MRHGRGGRKLERAGPPSRLGESAAVGGADASLPLAGNGRSSPDLVVDLSTTEVHAGDGGTSMAALAPLGVDRSRPRTRSITLQEGHPLDDGVFSELAVIQTCRKRKRSTSTDTPPPAEPIPELSDGIVLDILVRLPVKSILRCKSVCKGWRAIITDPFFVRAHLQHSASRCEQDPCLLIAPNTREHRFASSHIRFYQWQQGASMATLMHNKDFGSEFGHMYSFMQCDGLVLVPTDTGLYLFNPATRQTATLPHSDRNRHHRFCCAGLGLDPCTGNHKVVRAFFRSTDVGMEVFTVSGNSNGGGNAWREIKDDLPYPSADSWNHIMAFHSIVAVNGFLFWHLPSIHRDPSRPWGLLRLSLADETFGITRLPHSVHPDGFIGLDVLHGELCVSPNICKGTVTMWFLPIQEDGGQEQTWEQRYTVHLTGMYRPLAFLPDGRMMLYAYRDRKVRLYNMATAKLTTVCQLKRLKYRGRRGRPWEIGCYFKVHLYTESLVRTSL